MITTGNWADTVNPAFTKIFDDVFARWPEQYSQIFSISKSTQNFEKFSSGTGFGIAKDVAQGEEIPTDDPVQGFDVTFTHKKIGDAFKVSKELLEDDLFGIIAQKPKGLAEAIRRKVETDAADIFINGDNTTNNTGPDGLSLFNNAHTREDGGATQDNLEGTVTMSEAQLETAIVKMRQYLDGKGQILNIDPDLVIVPLDLEKEIRVIIQSSGRTGTTNLNEPNIYGYLDIFVWRWLTDATDWFVMDRKANEASGLKFVWRRPATIERDDNVSNDIARWYATARYSLGWTDWRSVHGFLD